MNLTPQQWLVAYIATLWIIGALIALHRQKDPSIQREIANEPLPGLAVIAVCLFVSLYPVLWPITMYKWIITMYKWIITMYKWITGSSPLDEKDE